MFSPVLHVAVALLCWLWKLGIVRGALRVTIVDRHRTHPVESRDRRLAVQVCTPNGSTMVPILCDYGRLFQLVKLVNVKRLYAYITAVTNALTELALPKAKFELVTRDVVRKGDMIQVAQHVSLMSFRSNTLNALSP